jgi:2-dehydro-3-deoxyphosphogluconate aldolase / (4S)-4-hydroxy-2-oxoglutarate aldolase
MQQARAETVALVERTGIVAIIRLKEAGPVRDLVGALMDGGVRALEITMTVPGAIELIRAIVPGLPAGFRLGAGTILDQQTAVRAIDAGASFIVTPVLQREVIEVCATREIPVMPGCFTPTEIHEAWQLGASVVKVFPATALGPQFFKDVRGPLPHIKLMPTGGVSIENAADWIRAGAVAVGVGGALMNDAAIAAGDYARIAASARTLVQAVAQAKGAR